MGGKQSRNSQKNLAKRQNSLDCPTDPPPKPHSRIRSPSLPDINQPSVNYESTGKEFNRGKRLSLNYNPKADKTSKLIDRTPTTVTKKKAPVAPPKRENTYVKHTGVPVVPDVPSEPSAKIVVGLYEYSSDTNGDLSFQKGERMIVLKQDGEWFYVRSCSNNKDGFIPSNYVAFENSIDSYDWYHGNITRNNAEKYLHAPGNILHTFLIRDSNSAGATAFALSVLDEDESRQKIVRHYRIRILSGDKGFYIKTTEQFTTLEELVNYYKTGNANDGDGGVSLSRPCAKARPSLKELSKDKWEICRGELDFEQKLGAGKFGEVHQGRWKNKPVAIKTLKEGSMDPDKFLIEADIMKRLQHHKLVALYAVCSVQQPFYIITELMSNGCLLNCLREDGGRQIRLPTLIDIAGQIADGMKFIEAKNYIHRDLAARNILVGDMYQVKVGDFGLSVAAKDASNTDKTEKFPVKWTSPEAMRENRFTIKSDVWSFGILLYEIITFGGTPYPEMNNREALQFVERGGRSHRPTNCPDGVYDVMLSCWRQKPEQRPTFESLYGTFEDYSIGDPSGQYQ